jgi:hypothetical protein
LMIGVRKAPPSVTEMLIVDVAPTRVRGPVTTLGSLAFEGLG